MELMTEKQAIEILNHSLTAISIFSLDNNNNAENLLSTVRQDFNKLWKQIVKLQNEIENSHPYIPPLEKIVDDYLNGVIDLTEYNKQIEQEKNRRYKIAGVK